MNKKLSDKVIFIKILGILLGLAGIALISFPSIKKSYYEHESSKLLEVYANELSNLEYNNEAVQTKTESDESKYAIDNMVGILKIDEISLEAPILEGTTKKNLNIGITTVSGSANAGEYGNFILAGHNFRDYGRGFNRLSEVNIGDLITVETVDKSSSSAASNRQQVSYTYEITDKQYVNPDEIWVLNSDMSIKEITLITCHYLEDETIRLVVKGALVE